MSRYRVSMDIGGTFTDVVAYDEETRHLRRRQGVDHPARPHRGRLRRARRRSSPRRPRSASPSTARRRGSTPSSSAAASGCCCWPRSGAGDIYHIARGNRTPPLRHPLPQADAARAARRHRRDRRPARLGGRGAGAARRGRHPGRRRGASATRGSARSPSPSSSATSTRPTSCAPRRSCARSWTSVTVSLSHRVAREWREYERTSSAVIDAYIAPVVRRYLERLETRAAAARSRRAAARDAVERRDRHRPVGPRALARRRCSPVRSAARWAASRWPACSTART